MIKVMWFLKRAEHLSLEQFREWWLTSHALDVVHHQAPLLRKYVVDVRREDTAFAGKASDDFDWDGVAEQWFEDEAAYNEVYDRAKSPTRGDTLAHTSRFARMVVEEHAFLPPAVAQ